MVRTRYDIGHGGAAQGPGPQTGVTLYRPIIVSTLYLLNLMLGFTVLIGLILAYIWRNDEDVSEWEETHFTYLIRTFWIGFWLIVLMIVGAIGLVLWSEIAGLLGDYAEGVNIAANGPAPDAIIAIMFGAGLTGFLLFVWYCVRSILSLANAANRRPMPSPKTWLF